MPIHFGTDGWRAVISDTFTFDNLRIVAQAIADAVDSDYWDKPAEDASSSGSKKIIVGYDTRFLSDRFAGEVARVLAANGFTVLLAQSDSPTPAISYAVKYQKAIAGIMITASHNAPRYNGVSLRVRSEVLLYQNNVVAWKYILPTMKSRHVDPTSWILEKRAMQA
jgi:phosphomannomutase